MLHELWFSLVNGCKDVKVSFEKEVATGLIFAIIQVLQLLEYRFMEARVYHIFIKIIFLTLLDEEDHQTIEVSTSFLFGVRSFTFLQLRVYRYDQQLQHDCLSLLIKSSVIFQVV